MQAAIAGFSPAFAPVDPNLAPDAFNSYLNGVETSNTAVSDGEVTYANAVNERRTAAEEIQDIALRLKNYVAANVSWKKFAPTVEAAAKLVRGTHLPKKAKAKTTTPPATPEPPAPARQGALSQQGFADVAKNFGKLIAAVKKVTGYTATASSGLTVAALEAKLGAFTVLNQAVTDAEADLAELQRGRAEYYDGENGLRDKMKAIKLAVRSQYGSGSPEDRAVKGIGL